MSSPKLPTIYLPHGGGPCFFMEWTMGPADTWNRMGNWLKEFGQRFSDARALLVVSAHWEATKVTVQSGERPPLLFDYYGFPPHTYELKWPANGAPELAHRVREILAEAGIDATENPVRGFDHGVFVPLKMAFPDASIPTLQLSLDASLDADRHLRMGHALEPLRNDGVLILGSGLSFHNATTMMGAPVAGARSRDFDVWLETACTGEPSRREPALSQWLDAPHARFCHPRQEHLLPLMVAAGAAYGEPARCVFTDQLSGVTVSAFEFGDAPQQEMSKQENP